VTIRELRCPNCGATADPSEFKCAYCGTFYVVMNNETRSIRKLLSVDYKLLTEIIGELDAGLKFAMQSFAHTPELRHLVSGIDRARQELSTQLSPESRNGHPRVPLAVSVQKALVELKAAEFQNTFSTNTAGFNLNTVDKLSAYLDVLVEEKKDKSQSGAKGKLIMLPGVCLKCGHKNPEGFNYCQRCGAQLKVSSESKKDETAEKPKKRRFF
jgi:ribosomal protein L40E/uncharacterized Zn-finger protein